MLPKCRTAMRGLLISIPGFASLVQAATQEVFMVNPLGTEAPLVASVVGASPAATTYAMACGSKFPLTLASLPSSVICPDLASITITQGPATLAYTSIENWATQSTDPSTNIIKALHCDLSGTTTAICTNSFDGLDKLVLPTQGLTPSEISMGQASLDALKVPETFTLTGKDFPAFGRVVVTAGAEKLPASGAGGAGAGASLSMSLPDTPDGVIGNPDITSIVPTSTPNVGGIFAPGVAKTSSGAAAAATVSGTAKASNTSTANQAAATGNKASALSVSVANSCSLVAGALAVILFL